MKVLDISPYYWEKMVLTMGSTLQVVKISAAKVRSGSVAPLEETKAKVMQASSQIEQQRAQQQLAASRLRLANSWGSTHGFLIKKYIDICDKISLF